MNELGQAPWVDELSREDIRNGGDPSGGRRWEELEEQGVNKQWLSQASTSTKNPDYSDVLYVEELVGLDHEAVTETLETEGVQKFADPFNEMLEQIEKKSRQPAHQS